MPTRWKTVSSPDQSMMSISSKGVTKPGRNALHLDATCCDATFETAACTDIISKYVSQLDPQQHPLQRDPAAQRIRDLSMKNWLPLRALPRPLAPDKALC